VAFCLLKKSSECDFFFLMLFGSFILIKKVISVVLFDLFKNICFILLLRT
jgi:hypothetical protein